MAYATLKASTPILGSFVHANTNKIFEYMEAVGPWASEHGLAYEVFVGPLGETRFAHIMKTVAYIATDEKSNGEPILQRWPIKKLTTYVNSQKG